MGSEMCIRDSGTVVLSNGKEIKEYTVRELLPAGFSAEDMKG